MQWRGAPAAAVRLLAGAGLAVMLVPDVARGSCGQSFCSVDARLSAEPPVARGQLRFDASMEYIEQDQPWVGFHSAEVGEIMVPEHQEVSTTNLTWKLTTEYAFTDRWSVSLMLPIVHREHMHLATESTDGGDGDAGYGSGAHGGETSGGSDAGTVTIGKATGTPERWNFTELGELQLLGRYIVQRQEAAADVGITVFAGLKLPTGRTNVRNDQGEMAEITLQPGTGSVDPIFGGNAQRAFRVPALDGETRDMPCFAGVRLRTPGSDGRYGFRPGTELLANIGTSYPLASRVNALGQINFRYKDSDHVGDAPGIEKADTGGESLYLSPGVNVRLADRTVAYSYVQVPVMQHVNGIQLTSWWNLLVGLTYELDV